jgi:CRP-like cAMP-binding protein
MPAPSQSSIANKLFAVLPVADYDVIRPHLEHCDLPKGTTLAKPGVPVEHIHFLTKGIGSVITVTGDNHRAEAGLFGSEGYVPAHAVAGLRLSPHEIVIQVDAEAYRLDFDIFARLLDENKNFRTVVLRSVAAFTIQLSFTATSNALYDVNERLARWLLMCHDRVQAELALTHEFIAIMLGVRRPSVTTALHVLEGNGFIRSQRGLIIIRNRRALEEFAQEAYGQPEEYERLMNDLR